MIVAMVFHLMNAMTMETVIKVIAFVMLVTVVNTVDFQKVKQ